MRRIKWEEYKKVRSAFVLNREPKTVRAGKGRQRDPEKQALLGRLHQVRWQHWLETGKLEQTGPRRYRFHLG